MGRRMLISLRGLWSNVSDILWTRFLLRRFSILQSQVCLFVSLFVFLRGWRKSCLTETAHRISTNTTKHNLIMSRSGHGRRREREREKKSASSSHLWAVSSSELKWNVLRARCICLCCLWADKLWCAHTIRTRNTLYLEDKVPQT